MASIFIVDDEENLHGVYKALFELRGHKVIGCAFDGDEAVQTFLQLNPKPDIIIMDHRMPRMDGISATKMIHEISRKSKIVFISADETVREAALEAGADMFQVKPVRASALFEIITKLTKAG
ncbi:MAG: response regulator [Candidatus Hermodarchaeota archaeon]|nr:response regulator [Candidatus Hermodarchaeota archaeon]